MLALKENQCYGLSGGKLSRGGNVSVFHVKLTDSAARALGSFQNGETVSSHPTICFNGNQGRITIPCLENKDDRRIFSFGVTNDARDNPNGSFDCVQQLGAGAAEELSCLGVIQKKMTVRATDDSYDKARQSMAQVEEETRSRGAIVIKQSGRYRVKKVTVRAPAPALAGLAKPRNPAQSMIRNLRKGVGVSKKSAYTSHRKSVAELQGRPLRDRVTHLLALRPYKRPELIVRLQSDGLTAGDKDTLDSVLTEVGQLSGRDNTFSLKDGLYKDVQKDWPGYTSGDQQLLKRILVRRLFQPQPNLLSVPEAQVSPLRDTPNSSPAHRPKPCLPEEYTDPLLSKKPRISHLSAKTGSDKPRVRTSRQPAENNGTETTGDHKQKNSLDPRKLFDSLSAVCQQEEEAAKRLQPAHQSIQEEPSADPSKPAADPLDPPQVAPDQDRHTIKRKKSKHKEQEKTRGREKKERKRDARSEEPAAVELTEQSEILFDSSLLRADKEAADYLSSYTKIQSYDQRQNYKLDFNREYSEYRDIHARIDGVTRQFMELDTQLKQLHHQSHKYKTVHDRILQEYRKIKKSNPNFNQEKIRCEYLHNKLAHIKKLISEYDQQQLESSPN